MLSPDTQYKIYSVATSLPVARNRVEDRSLLPKRVVTLPDGMDHAPWVVQRDGEGYRLQNQGAATTHIDGNLFAPLLDEPPPKSWVLTEQPDAGQGVYTIKAADSDEGWVVDDDNNEPFQQVRIRRLSSSDIPKNELFRFVPSGDF